MRRTRERRALDALLKLGVLNADKLTDDDVRGIALCLRRVKVADDVRVVESMIAGGGACLPEMCVNDHARMLGDDGRVLGVLDVYHLSNGATHVAGIADETGTCTHIDICGHRLPTTAPGYGGEIDSQEFADSQCALIQDWTEEHIGVLLPVTATKDFAITELWDDRAIGVKLNEGEPKC